MSEWHSVDFAPQGWQCPICKRVYSPMTTMCYYCGNGVVTTSTSTTLPINKKDDAIKQEVCSMKRRLFGKYMLFKDEPETETLKADYISKAVDELLHDMTGNGIIPDWETMQIIVKEGFNILSGPDWYEEEKEDYKGPYVGWAMTVGIKFYSENYPE